MFSKDNRKSKVDEQILYTRTRKRIWGSRNKNRNNKIKRRKRKWHTNQEI